VKFEKILGCQCNYYDFLNRIYIQNLGYSIQLNPNIRGLLYFKCFGETHFNQIKFIV